MGEDSDFMEFSGAGKRLFAHEESCVLLNILVLLYGLFFISLLKSMGPEWKTAADEVCIQIFSPMLRCISLKF